jgi:ribosomal protein S18 acetylase RimI-like enzyme
MLCFMALSEVKIITEIPRIENTRSLMAEAAEFLFVEVGQKALGDDPHDVFARQHYIDEVEECRLFVALNKKATVIGAATLDLILPGEGHVLNSIAVARKYRRQKIGSKLLELAEDAVLGDRFNKLSLYPTEKAVKFYTKHSYKEDKYEPNKRPMVKKLGQ